MTETAKYILELVEWAYNNVKNVKCQWKNKKVDPLHPPSTRKYQEPPPFMKYPKRYLIERGWDVEESKYDEAEYRYDDPDEDRTLIIKWEKGPEREGEVRIHFHDYGKPRVGTVFVYVYSYTLRPVKRLAREALQKEIDRLKEKVKD